MEKKTILVGQLGVPESRIIMACSGADALDKFQKEFFKPCKCQVSFVMLVIDMNMPIMNGLELANKIQQMVSDNEGLRPFNSHLVGFSFILSDELKRRSIKMCIKEIFLQPLDEDKLKRLLQLYYNPEVEGSAA